MLYQLKKLGQSTTSSLALLLGLYAIGFWALSVLQFVHAYYQLGEFDTSVAEFLAIELLLFAPLLLYGTFVTAEYVRNLRLNLWMRKNLTYSEYDINYPPAESGLLLDYKFGSSEIVATLLDLHFRRVVYMDIDGDSLRLRLLVNPKQSLSAFEQELINQIFKNQHMQSFDGFRDRRLKQRSRKAHKKLLKWGEESGLMLNLIPKILKPFIPILLLQAFVGFFVSLLAVTILFTDYETASKIGYPRYPVDPLQLISVSVVSLIGALVLLSGFWPRFKSDHKSKPVATWVKTYGLKLYLKTVYTDRFALENVSHLSSQDIKKYAPYMIAFQLVPNNTTYVKKLLSSVK